MAQKFTQFACRHPFKFYFLACFAFTLTTAFCIQLALLPYVLPHLHGGHGLLAGGDWLGFHQLAESQAHEIVRLGWGEWRLSPGGHAPAGIASMFYAIFTAEPWVLIPLNAAIHAGAAVLLARMLWMITDCAWISILSTLPFLMFPSAATWYSQIHKEGYYIFGYFLCLHGWMQIVQLRGTDFFNKSVFRGGLCILTGVLIAAAMRDFGAMLIAAMSSLFALAISVRLLAAAWPILTGRVLMSVVLFLAIPIFIMKYSTNHYVQSAFVVSGDVPSKAELDSSQDIKSDDSWINSPILPRAIDVQFSVISELRRNFYTNYSGAKTNIDANIRFNTAVDFLTYLPRAVQVGMLAPFPEHWMALGSSVESTWMRRITAIEMLVSYFSFLFVPYLLWRKYRVLNGFLFAQINFFLILLYTYTVPNVGALYRMRYGFYTAIVALGIAGIFFVVEKFIPKKTKP